MMVNTKDLFTNIKRRNKIQKSSDTCENPHPRPIKKGSKEEISQLIRRPILVLKRAPISLPPQDPH